MGKMNPMRSSPNQKPLLPNKSLLPTKEASNRVNKAKEFEKEFNYGKKGIVPTQRDWAEYFWTVHKNRVAEALRPPIGEAISMLVVGVGTGDVLSAIAEAARTSWEPIARSTASLHSRSANIKKNLE